MLRGSIELKIIMRDGIVDTVLCDDTRLPLDVEVVDVCKDFDDYEKLSQYAYLLESRKENRTVFFTYTQFTDDDQ